MESPIFKDYYEVLGLKPNASPDDVRKAYKRRALETHPDKLDQTATEDGRQAADEQFHQVKEAFETLGDEQKRKAYDTQKKSKTNPLLISDEARQKIKERREWAERQREESERRIAAIRAKVEQEKREAELAKENAAKEAALVEEMVKNMYALNPEFAARREAALQRKAKREKEELARLSQQHIVRY